MVFLKFLRDRFNLALFGFVAVFLLVPLLETQVLYFPVTPFIFLLVLILNFRILALPPKFFWQLFLLAILAFCLDLLLVFVLNGLLEGILTILIHGIYSFCFVACLWALIRRFYAPETNPHQLLKMGFCGYFSIGFLWMVFYSFIAALNPRAFAGLPVDNVRFFYFSFSVLSLLIPNTPLALTGLWIKYLANLEAMAGQVFLVILIVRAVVLYRSQEART